MSPAQQSIVDLVQVLSNIENVAEVDVTLSELEKNVEDFKVTLEGYDLSYDRIGEAIKDFGAVIRNVDNVVSAEGYIPKHDSNKLSASMLVLASHIDSDVENIDLIYSEFDKTLHFIRSNKT
jgi:hypothetical protein